MQRFNLDYDMVFLIGWLVLIIFYLPLVYLFLKQLPSRYRRNPKLTFLFFYLLACSIFIYGIIIVFGLITFLVYYQPKRKQNLPILTATYPIYQSSPIRVHEQYGEGFAFKALSTKGLSKSIRTKMLVAINQFANAQINQINASVLTDEVDEMRLYAQSLIEKQERHLLNQIKIYTDKLTKSRTEFEAAFYKKELAEIMWEQIYNYLVTQENITIVLDRITNYAQEALAVMPNDIGLPLLLAKCALKKKNYEEAKKWLIKAEENGAPQYKIVSYFAEIAFIHKDYPAVAKILSTTQSKDILGLQPILKFWVKHD